MQRSEYQLGPRSLIRRKMQATHMSGSAKCAPYDKVSVGLSMNLKLAWTNRSRLMALPRQLSPLRLLRGMTGPPGMPEPGTCLCRGGIEKLSHCDGSAGWRCTAALPGPAGDASIVSGGFCPPPPALGAPLLTAIGCAGCVGMLI